MNAAVPSLQIPLLRQGDDLHSSISFSHFNPRTQPKRTQRKINRDRPKVQNTSNKYQVIEKIKSDFCGGGEFESIYT